MRTTTVRDFANGVNRVDPGLPPGAYQTYEISAPRETHYRKATCEEVDCEHWRNGWTTTVIADSPEEAALKKSGRKWSERLRVPDGVCYVFPAGTKCFRSFMHVQSLERPPLLVVQGGDWRGRDVHFGREFKRPEDFLDHMRNHQDDIATKIMNRR